MFLRQDLVLEFLHYTYTMAQNTTQVKAKNNLRNSQGVQYIPESSQGVCHLLFDSNFLQKPSLLPVSVDGLFIFIRRKKADNSTRNNVAHVIDNASQFVHLKTTIIEKSHLLDQHNK